MTGDLASKVTRSLVETCDSSPWTTALPSREPDPVGRSSGRSSQRSTPAVSWLAQARPQEANGNRSRFRSASKEIFEGHVRPVPSMFSGSSSSFIAWALLRPAPCLPEARFFAQPLTSSSRACDIPYRAACPLWCKRIAGKKRFARMLLYTIEF